MIAALVLLVILVLVLAGLFLFACVKVEQHQEELRDRDFTEHYSCIDSINRAVSAAHDATLLRHLADRWDSVEEQGNLRILAREKYLPGGPAMPALWLRQQADKIEGLP